MPKNNVVILIAAVNGHNEMIEKIEAADKCFNKNYFIICKGLVVRD